MPSKRQDLQPRNNTEPSENASSSHNRRAALKKIAIGAGIVAGAAALPGKWTKPMVDKVLVPAHAQTSSTTVPPVEPTTTTTTTTTLNPCVIDCDFNIQMNWDVACSNTSVLTGNAFVELRVIPPNGENTVGPANLQGECIEVKNHASSSDESGGATIGAINSGQLSKGQYRIYTDIVRRDGCVDNIRLGLSIGACNTNISRSMNTNATGTFSWGTISVQTNGSANIRLN